MQDPSGTDGASPSEQAATLIAPLLEPSSVAGLIRVVRVIRGENVWLPRMRIAGAS